MTVPKSHPRYVSLMTRERIVNGVKSGITSEHGLIAQGRGEAFDYLIGEKTTEPAKKAIEAGAALLLLAKNPVISVNGNAAALCAEDIVRLSKIVNAKIEVNIFHSSKKRENAIKKLLLKNGAKEVLMPSKKYKIKFIEHNRKYVNPEGILRADVVFVPLEDGDRCQALINNGKKVITVDLNPMSRTAKAATVTIVDNIIRAIKLLCEKSEELKKKDKKTLEKIAKSYNNKKTLNEAIKSIKTNLFRQKY
jgi:4-phosphopantoate--beta-alanine ligase